MDGQKIAECLYEEFGNKEFLTREISPETMGKLVKLMGITGMGHSRNTKVGRGIGSLDQGIFTLDGDGMVIMYVNRPEDPRQPRSFKLVNYRPVDDKLRAEALAVESRRAGGPYSVVLVSSEEGCSAICTALPGCVSQGDDEEEAISNIEEAIIGWLACEGDDVERRTRDMLEEYQAAGYAARLVKISLV